MKCNFLSVPPVISNVHPSHNLTVRKGSTVKLVCNATGFPVPEISWQREVSEKFYVMYSKHYIAAKYIKGIKK